MNTRVLVLNQDFSPLMVCSVERAFILVYLKKSELVRPANGYKLRSVTQSFPMPSVIRLNRYVNAPYKGVNLTRQNIFKRDGNECQYCGTRKELTIDHVTPRASGGVDSWTNLVTACKKCNTKKRRLYSGRSRNEPAQKTREAILLHFSKGSPQRSGQ